jgi:ubiquinone/menaquinone biosynthesis C-methylase UbiE
MIDQERIFRIDPQNVTLPDFPAEGFILDVGGGGEAVIGQLKGAQVVAIDIFPRELAEAPAGPLKIIMDAREMKFLDATFSTVTSFFAFMFIHPDDQVKVLQEIFRVLASKGQFMFWDVEIPQRINEKQDVFVFSLQVTLPATVISTGYGTPFTEKQIGLEHYKALATQAGFQVLEEIHAGQTFFCRFEKP